MFAAVNSYQFFSASSGEDPYRVAFQHERMRAALTAIPAGVTAGYVSDTGPEDAMGAAVFDVARYALAPRPLLLLPDAGRPEWTLGCFLRPYDAAAIAARNGLTVAADYRNGVVVFRRAE